MPGTPLGAHEHVTARPRRFREPSPRHGAAAALGHLRHVARVQCQQQHLKPLPARSSVKPLNQRHGNRDRDAGLLHRRRRLHQTAAADLRLVPRPHRRRSTAPPRSRQAPPLSLGGRSIAVRPSSTIAWSSSCRTAQTSPGHLQPRPGQPRVAKEGYSWLQPAIGWPKLAAASQSPPGSIAASLASLVIVKVASFEPVDVF